MHGCFILVYNHPHVHRTKIEEPNSRQMTLSQSLKSSGSMDCLVTGKAPVGGHKNLLAYKDAVSYGVQVS